MTTSRNRLAQLPLVRTTALALIFSCALAGAARADFACNISVSGGSSGCGFPVTIDQIGGGRAAATANVAGYAALVLRVFICSPSGFSVHIGDSPTNNGGGGDSGWTRHDAELQLLNSDFSVFRSDYGSGLEQYRGVSAALAGCRTQQYLVRNDYAEMNPDVNLSGVFIHQVPESRIFDFPPYDESDNEDPNSFYANTLYIGLNRVYDLSFDPSRTGSGVSVACVYLSTSPFPSLSSITSLCGF